VEDGILQAAEIAIVDGGSDDGSRISVAFLRPAFDNEPVWQCRRGAGRLKSETLTC
jgi:hypothetical protein